MFNSPFHRRGHHGGPFAAGPFGPGQGRRGGRGQRLLHRGELKLLVLKLLEAGPRHGYDLIKDVETRTGGAYAPSPGILYPTLALLEDTGAIAAEADGTRKQFALTDLGRAELAENAERIAELLARLDGVGQSQAASEVGPVRRALDNLRQVLAASTIAEPLSKAAQLDIADILDDAARKIERL